MIDRSVVHGSADDSEDRFLMTTARWQLVV